MNDALMPPYSSSSCTWRPVVWACTAEPNSAWVTQQARNLSWKLSDEGINVRVVVHDRDR